MNIKSVCSCSYKITADGKTFCPVHDRQALFQQKSLKLKEEFFGESPAVFVGRFNYPNVNVGIMAPPELRDDTWLYDAPGYWGMHNYQIPQIVDFRADLVNSRFKANVKARSKFLEISREIGMASKPVDVEIQLRKKPIFRMQTSLHIAPTGPNANLRNVLLAENPKISAKVERVVDDVHLKADEALVYLYKNKFDENFLSRLISIGNVGTKVNRKLVPTRWSITAVDDTLGKHIISEVKEHPTMGHSAFFGSYLGNYYLILVFPEVWSYELFETYVPSNPFDSKNISFTTDYEPYAGRKTYAENTVGGYYTVRLAVLEKLREMKRQGSVLALRFITDEYMMPLGVWVTREAARKAMNNKAIEFASEELMLRYASLFIKKKFGYDIGYLLKRSKLLENIKQQAKLSTFMY